MVSNGGIALPSRKKSRSSMEKIFIDSAGNRAGAVDFFARGADDLCPNYA